MLNHVDDDVCLGCGGCGDVVWVRGIVERNVTRGNEHHGVCVCV